MKPEHPGFLRDPKTLAILLIILILAAVATRVQRGTALPPLEPGGTWVEVEKGTRVAVRVLDSVEAAQRTLGFDIRAAGVLPVRLAIDNQGAAAVRIEAPQTFLIDRRDLAWPLLTADQAVTRLRAAPGAGAPPRKPDSRPWARVPETLTGFALDVILRGDPDPDGPETGFLGIWAARFRGGDLPTVEHRVINHLLGKFPRNPNLEPGQSAEGYLLFPGATDEASGIVALRLGLALDGRVRVLEISPAALKLAP